MYLIRVHRHGCHGCTWSSHTYGQSHDLEPVPHQFDYHALLQRRGAAAEHWTTASCHSQELIFQTFIKGVGQSASINNQAKPMHHEGGGLPGGGGGRCRWGGIHLKGCEAAVIGLGRLVCSAAEEFGLKIVQTLLQQQGACLLVQRQTQRVLVFRNCVRWTSGVQMLNQNKSQCSLSSNDLFTHSNSLECFCKTQAILFFS